LRRCGQSLKNSTTNTTGKADDRVPAIQEYLCKGCRVPGGSRSLTVVRARPGSALSTARGQALVPGINPDRQAWVAGTRPATDAWVNAGRQSEPIAFSRGSDIGGGVGREQQAVGDTGGGRGLDPSDIDLPAAIAFFERRAWVTGSLALASGPGE
jgi:hypothetical protein